MRALRSVERLIAGGRVEMKDSYSSFNAGIQYFYMSKTLEAGCIPIPAESRDAAATSRIMQWTIKATLHFIQSVKVPSARWMSFYMAGKMSYSVLRRAARQVRHTLFHSLRSP